MNEKAVRFWWGQWSTIFSGTMTAFAIGVAIWISLRPTGSPVTYEVQQGPTPIIEWGDTLQVKLTAYRKRECPARVDAWFVDSKNLLVYTFPPAPGGFTKVGTTSFTLKKLTSVLPSDGGDFAYRAMVISSCDDQQYTVFTPDFRFVLLPKGEQ